MKRRSGLQNDVLSLYRKILRVAKSKDNLSLEPKTFEFAREKFRIDATNTKRSDFKRVEFLLRQGHKRLRQLSLPGVKVASFVSSFDQKTSNRPFSTQGVLRSQTFSDGVFGCDSHLCSGPFRFRALPLS